MWIIYPTFHIINLQGRIVDTPMNGPTLPDSMATTSAHGGTVVPSKKPRRKKMHTTIIPESAPSRNLRS